MKMIKRMISSVAVVLMLASGLQAGESVKASQPKATCSDYRNDVFESLNALAAVYGDKEAVKMVNRVAYHAMSDPNCTNNICGRFPDLCCCDNSCLKMDIVKLFVAPVSREAKR